MNKNIWALVLAAGEGNRLRELTMTSTGLHVPKQFCSLLNGPTLLDEAWRRAQSVAPRERVCTIVAAQHQRWWEHLPATLPASNMIVQPRNRGTANGILLALLHIVERDRDAQVVLLPSDHYVQAESTLAESLVCAATQLRVRPDAILLLGLEAGEPDPELGYIVPGERGSDGAYEVAQFVEKPTVARARDLIEAGALWNAFIIAATAQALLRSIECRFAGIVRQMREAVRKDLHSPAGASAMTELYDRLPDLDFSRDVLGSGRDANLRVLRVPHCGWSDLGTFRRVAKTLGQLRPHRHTVETPFDIATHVSLATRLETLQEVRVGA